MLSQSTQNEIAKNQSTLFTVNGMVKTAQPVMANKYSAPVPTARTVHSTSSVIMSATPQGPKDNFVSKMGEKLNNAIDSVGQELNYMANPQSKPYMQLATGMGSIPAENPINQNVMKFQQIQNSMPQNSSMAG